MSSIMRARSALTGRTEGWEVIGGSSLELKVAGPSMLGIRCPGRHALPLTPPQRHRPPRALQSRESGFVHGSNLEIARLQPQGQLSLRVFGCLPVTARGAAWRQASE